MSHLKPRRIPARYHAGLVGTTLTVALTAVVSLGITIMNAGLTLDTLLPWLAAWQIATLIAVPARFALLPVVTRLVGLFVEKPAAQH